ASPRRAATGAPGRWRRRARRTPAARIRRTSGRWRLHQLGAAEEVTELDDDEDEKQQIDETQRGADRDDPEGQRLSVRRRGRRRPSDQRAPEVAGGEGRPECGERQV